MSRDFDAIVLGLGAMGSAALYQLAKRDKHVLGIDQFSPPHDQGSSHGETRVTRLAIGEGKQYTPLALRSHELWRQIEAQTSEKLLTVTGGLIMCSSSLRGSSHMPDFFKNTLAAANEYGIKHELLNTSEIRNRFPQFKVPDDEVGYYEYGAGFVRPEQCIRAQLSLAKQHGAELHTKEKVLELNLQNTIQIITPQTVYSAKQLVITAGPWISQLISEFSSLLTVQRQVLYWFDLNDAIENYLPERFPVFLWEMQDRQGIYGFPAINGKGGGIKIASSIADQPGTTPEQLNRSVTEIEIRNMYGNYVAPYLSGVSERCLKTATCMYSVTPDYNFIIDRHPLYKNVILASPCSGHGFKHSAAIGEVLAELIVDGKSTTDLSSFALSRFSNNII